MLYGYRISMAWLIMNFNTMLIFWKYCNKDAQAIIIRINMQVSNDKTGDIMVMKKLFLIISHNYADMVDIITKLIKMEIGWQ